MSHPNDLHNPVDPTSAEQPQHRFAGANAAADIAPGVPSAQRPEVERRALLGGLVGGVAGAALLLGGRAQVAHAGPLTPPSGPVAPTAGPEPRTAINAVNTPGTGASVFSITQPGSYYLTGNLAIPANGNGIGIVANDVTIDLNGFTLTGGLNGVAATLATAERITIRNGTMVNQTGRGVLCTANAFVTVEHVSVSNSALSGISLGEAARVINCSVSGGGASGTSGTHAGILCGARAVVSGCTVKGFVGGSGSFSGGIRVGAGSVIADCTSADCTFSGFSLDKDCVAYRCAARGGQFGIYTDAGCYLEACNASASTARGISLSQSTAVGCSVTACPDNSFTLLTGSTARNCMVIGPTTPGTSIGVLAGPDAVVIGCRVMGCNTGFSAANNSGAYFSGNFSGNAATNNWSIGSGNYCLVVAATSVAAPITGNTGGSSPGSTNPYANFTI